MQILILGAGYAGLRTALDLAEAKHKGQLNGISVTLVDQNDYHQVITWLHDIAAAAVEPQKARIPLDRLLGQGGVTLKQATVRGIAPSEQRVLLTDGTALLYEKLVIALGSDTLWAPIPGLRDYALPMRWWDEAMKIRDAILYNFALAAETSDEAERKRLLSIVVIGGGYTGCQLAGELTHWLPALADEYGISLFDLTLRQIEAQSHLLPNWERRFSDKAERILRRKGVQVLLNSPVAQIEEKTLTIKGKQPLPYGVLVWVGGVRAPKMLQTSGFQTGIQGRIKVDAYLRATAFPNTYVIGDSSLWMDGEQPLPATASHALRQGEYVARMLIREVNRQALARYEPTKLGLVVSLGGNDGIGTALGVPLSGLAAGILKEGIEAWYMSTIGVE